VAAIVLRDVHQFGLTGLATITLLAGIIQVVLGAARLGKWIEVIPKITLEGVLSAIGIVISLGQLHIMLGRNIPESAIASLAKLPESLLHPSRNDAVIGVATMGLLILWPLVFKPLKWIPAALPAVAIMTLAALPFPAHRVALGSWHDLVVRPSLNLHLTLPLLAAALGLAIIASAETLITARATDILARHTRPHHKPAKSNQELVAQGVGNVLAALLGGTPITAVMVRSAANVASGARTRASAVLHGVWVALFVVLAPGIIREIPLSALASVLIFVGWRLIGFKAWRECLEKQPAEALLWLGTIGNHCNRPPGRTSDLARDGSGLLPRVPPTPSGAPFAH
jgi:carbonic anhydrase